MLSDERLDYLISIHDESAEHDASIRAALEELLALRRRDAAIEKAFDDPNYELWISRGKRFEITLYDTAGEREREIFADTFSEALSALAAGLEGEHHA